MIIGSMPGPAPSMPADPGRECPGTHPLPGRPGRIRGSDLDLAPETIDPIGHGYRMRIASLCFLLGVLAFGTGASAQERREATVGESTISYLDAGTGPPLLLLHGFGETGATWDALLEPLASRYRVIVPDLPGHGRSSELGGAFSFRDVASDIVAFLDHLEIPETHAVGFSAGGIVLLHVATTQPDHLASMTVVGAGPYLPESAREFMRAMDAESIPMQDLQAGELAQPDTARTRDLVRRFVALADVYEDPNFTAPLLGRIDVPTFFVTGDADPFFPTSVVQEMHEAVPSSHLLVLPNHGHMPLPSGDSGRQYFIDSLVAFLEGAWGSPEP